MALADKAQQLDQKIAAAVKTTLGNLRQELDDRLRQSTESLRERIEGIENVLPAQFLAVDDLTALAREEAQKASLEAVARLVHGAAALDAANSQAAVLATLLEQAHAYASRVAVFLTPAGAARGWGGLGFGEAGGTVAGASIPYSSGAGWTELASGRGWVSLSAAESADLASRLECPMAREAVLVPMVLANQVAAALYADTTEDAHSLELPALQLLVHAAAAAIEGLPQRQRSSNPTFTEAASGTGSGLPLWASTPAPTISAPPPVVSVAVESTPVAAASPAPILPPPQAPEPLIELEVAQDWEPEPVAPEPPLRQASATAQIPVELPEAEPWEETAAELFTPTAAVEDEVVPPSASEPSLDIDLDAGDRAFTEEMPALGEDSAALPWPEPTVPAEADEYELPPISDWTEPAASPVVEEPRGLDLVASTLRMPAVVEPPPVVPPHFDLPPVDISDDATMLIPRRPVVPVAPPPPVEVEPAEEPEEEATHPGRGSYAPTRAMPKPGGAGAEVRPPSGFEGPGLAFARSQQRAVAEPAGHEEARRLARLLVSEIRLYNEDQVEEGKRNRDIYSRLRDEIDRSRKMYDERISVDVRSARDYFTEELVRRLADGDPDALGM